MNVASVEGLEGLSIGRLATELDMSKSGLFAHFGSKEELQVATVRAAAAIFVHRVIRDAEERFEPGLARLRAVLDSWLGYMERGTFAGGCFFAAATVEMDGRPGPVRDAVAAQMRSWADCSPTTSVPRSSAVSCAPTPIPRSSPSSSTRSAPP